jgi:hypothetical protein
MLGLVIFLTVSSIILSHLRDRSMGQAGEIQGLLDMMKRMEKAGSHA